MSENVQTTINGHISIIKKYYPDGANVVTDCGESIRAVLKDLAAKDAECEALRKDAERFTWFFSETRSGCSDVCELYIKQISGECPTIDDWRTTIDAAIEKDKQ